jgi:hypothetical protein
LELQGELETYMAAHNFGSSSREIGSFVADLFTDFRQETKKAIEDKLAREGSLTWAESGSISIAPSASVSPQSKELLSPQTTQRRQLIAWVIGSIICVTLVLLFALIWKNVKRPTLTGSGRSGSMAIPSTLGSLDLAPVHWVNLRISASPASAVILIDGKSIAGNPASISVEGDGSSHTVTVQAADHKPHLLSIVYDRDQDVVVALEQASPATNATPKAIHPPRLSPPPPASSPVIPPKDCDPPYYMDERGIKRFKTGCI